MKIRASIIVAAAITVATVAAIEGVSTYCHRLHFDGVYRVDSLREIGGGLYLRFYGDGTVLARVVDYDPDGREAREMRRGVSGSQLGRYTLERGVLTMSIEGIPQLPSPSDLYMPWGVLPQQRTWHFVGEVHCDRLQILSAYGHGVYKFMKVAFSKET